MPEQRRQQFLGERERALEEAFFSRHNAELRERLRAERERHAARHELMQISGVRDEALLDKLESLGIGGGAWAALSLIPLVEVAWANGAVDAKERSAVLSFAAANGLSRGGVGLALLDSWLGHRPDGRLLQAWGEYVVDLCSRLSPSERQAFREEVMSRARAVAEAAGGLLGLGSKISPEEEVVLAELEKAFD
jgi:hypothetical protein